MTTFDVDTALLRVSVLSERTQLDVTVPATLPVAAVIGELVPVLTARDPDPPPADQGVSWALAPIGRPAIPPESTLTQAGVYDGALLMLSRCAAVSDPPVFDDIVDGIAQLSHDRPAWSSAAAARLGRVIAVAGSVVAAGIAVFGAVVGTASQRPLWATGIALVAVIAWATGVLVARHGGPDGAAIALLMAAPAAAAAAGLVAVPGPPGPPGVLLGAALCGLTVMTGWRLSGLAPAAHAALLTVAAAVGVGAGAALALDPAPTSLAAIAAVAGVLLIGAAPRIAMTAARLPLPPVPTAGAPLDLDDPEPPALTGVAAIGAISLPDVGDLDRRARLTDAYLSGLVIGLSLLTAAGAITVLLIDISWLTTSFTAIVAAVLALRGRTHADLLQASTVVGAAAVIALIVCGVLATGGGWWPIAGFLGAAGIAAAALAVGDAATGHEFSPAMRRAAELGEYLLLAALLPLLCWLLDLYAMVRAAL